MGNLGRQFTREEMVIVGARLLGSPPIIWRPEWPRIHYATVIPPRSWRGARWIHWFQFPWLVFYTLILSLFARTRVLLVVFPDEIYLLAGYITSVLTRKPLILYFHNTYLELRSANRLARWLQPRAFRRAQHVFVMSEGMQRFYQQRYPDLRCSPLVHTFNEPLPHFDDLGSALDDLHDPLQLALSGNINASNGGAVQHMAEAIKALPNTQMLIYSGTAPKYLERLGLVGESFSVASLERDVHNTVIT